MCEYQGQPEPCIPFSNGTEFECWDDRNCDRCVKGAGNNGDALVCPIEEALTEALFGDGEMRFEMAARMGLHERERTHAPDGLPYLGWPCKEFEAPDAPEHVRMDQLGMPTLWGGT